MIQVVDGLAPGVRTLLLNRPESRNALTTSMAELVADAVADAAADSGVRALVIATTGEDFGVGADRNQQLDATGRARRMRAFSRLHQAVTTAPKPVVAAVEGRCVAVAAELAAACDIRVGADGSSFRFPGAEMGIPIGAARLVGVVGPAAARDILLTSRWVPADEAFRIGLLQRLVPRGEARAAAVEVAAQTARADPVTSSHLKRQLQALGGDMERMEVERRTLDAFFGPGEGEDETCD
ncbi:enoyl-CoA hydratase/isomerase family protein [Streptomyces sp. NPDC051207]|uniref:enoyl-CoA hydratase/isomerase family protein n=1 Tax=Streptomyces sp. NPDC051207 TaxID=3154641 RepID=UPI00343EF00F